jgi:hypothetical protein
MSRIVVVICTSYINIRSSRSRMVEWLLDLQLLVQSLSINTKVVSSNLGYGEVYSIKHYMIKLVSDLRQVAGFLRVLRFSPPIKLIVAI